MKHDEALDLAQGTMENLAGLMPLWHLAEAVACHSRMTRDEAEDELRELLTEWVAARIEEAGEE